MNLMEKYKKKLQVIKNEIYRETTSNNNKSISSDDLLYVFEERAAIMEFDGNMSRGDAEREARLLMKVGI